jgi:uncharacterized protein YqhQ
MPYSQTFWDGPSSFPTIISIILLAVCIAWLFDLIREQARNKKNRQAGEMQVLSKEDDKQKEILKKKKERKQFIVIGVLVVLYIMVLMPLIPFPVATFVFLTCSFLIFSTSKWWKSLIISGSVSVCIYLIFIYVLHLPMPR